MPDDEFFEHALEDKFSIPKDKVAEFKEIFLASLQSAQLVEKKDDKFRILDTKAASQESATNIKRLSTAAHSAGHSCFVLMPFGSPIGDYYAKIYEPAIKKAGLRPVHADADMFGTGKIMDQIWEGNRRLVHTLLYRPDLSTRNADADLRGSLPDAAG